MLRRLLDLVYAPLAAVIYVIAGFLLCVAVILGPTLRLRRQIGRVGVRLSLACIGVPMRVRGLEHLPAGPCVVVSNHASYLDGLVLTSALPSRFVFVVKDDASSWPLLGWTIRRMGVTFVNREEARAGAAQTRMLIRRLQEGESLALFAEGTFKREPGLLSFKNGAFLMAARAQVPVVPAGIRGTRRVYGGGHRLPRWGRIDIELGKPILPQGEDRSAALQLRDQTRRAVLQLCGEPDRGHGHHAEAEAAPAEARTHARKDDTAAPAA